MFKKPVLLQLLLLLALGGTLPGCTAFRELFNQPIVVNQGPSVLRDSTAVFTQVALVKHQATVEQATAVRTHIADAKALFLDGTPPGEAIDQLAAYLNSKIDNPFVRSAIQQGVMLLKNQVTLPAGQTFLTEGQIAWVLAVLDGGIAGCDNYISGKAISASGEVVISAPDVINFRDTSTRTPNDGWIDFRR